MALLIVTPFIGYDLLCDHLQKGQAFTGTIVRTYSEKAFLSRSNGSRRRYWDIRDDRGEVHSLRIQSRQFWDEGHVGQSVVKRAGESQPHLVGP